MEKSTQKLRAAVSLFHSHTLYFFGDTIFGQLKSLSFGERLEEKLRSIAIIVILQKNIILKLVCLKQPQVSRGSFKLSDESKFR